MADKPFPFSVCEQCCVGSDGDGIVNITVNSTKDKITVEYSDGSKKEFALIGNGHKHKIADISDYKVDDALSDTSTRPVQNKIIKEQLDILANSVDNSLVDISTTMEDDGTSYLLCQKNNGEAIESLGLPLVTTIYVDNQIGDIEKALENIIAEYGLGGDVV